MYFLFAKELKMKKNIYIRKCKFDKQFNDILILWKAM